MASSLWALGLVTMGLWAITLKQGNPELTMFDMILAKSFLGLPIWAGYLMYHKIPVLTYHEMSKNVYVGALLDLAMFYTILQMQLWVSNPSVPIVEGIIFNLIPVLTAIIGFTFIRDRVTKYDPIAIIGILLGVILISFRPPTSTTAVQIPDNIWLTSNKNFFSVMGTTLTSVLLINLRYCASKVDNFSIPFYTWLFYLILSAILLLNFEGLVNIEKYTGFDLGILVLMAGAGLVVQVSLGRAMEYVDATFVSVILCGRRGFGVGWGFCLGSIWFLKWVLKFLVWLWILGIEIILIIGGQIATVLVVDYLFLDFEFAFSDYTAFLIILSALITTGYLRKERD